MQDPLCGEEALVAHGKFWLHSLIAEMCPHQTWVAQGAAGLLAVASCLATTTSCRPTESPAKPQPGEAVPQGSTRLLTAHRPAAATLSADGSTLYLLAMDEAGSYQLYQGAVGSALSAVSTALSLAFPVAILATTDGSQLVIVDYGAAGADAPSGAVYAGSAGAGFRRLGGSSSPTYPSAAALARDERSVYITGRIATAAGTEAALWQAPLSGEDATPIFRGSPLSQPIGLAQASDGSLYVADADAAGSQRGALFRRVGERLLQVNQRPLALSFPSGVCAAGRNSPDVLFTTAVASGSEPWLQRMSPDGALQDVVLPAVTDATSLSRASAADRWVAIDAVLPSSSPSSATPTELPLDGAVLLLSP